MSHVLVDAQDAHLTLRWPDGPAASYPYLWLRDNCPSGFHPQTEERLFDLLSVPDTLRAASAAVEDGALVVAWEGDGHVSRFPLSWLEARRPGRPAEDAAAVDPVFWRGDVPPSTLPRIDGATMMRDDAALLEWLVAAKKTGLALVTGLSDDVEAGFAAAERIGFLRQTNFGKTFEVISKPDPNNLAYTAHALPLHTDLPNQEMPPGFQFLHCIANDAEGGGSVFCDGFAIAEDLRTTAPESFELLANTLIPFRFHDRDVDIRKHDTVIRTGQNGAVEEIRYNAHLADVFDMPAEVSTAYYRAYRAFMGAVRSDAYCISLKLGAGEMVVFDNRRVLHGRSAFDPSTGFRRLRGCYVDRGEWDSRIRVLSRG